MAAIALTLSGVVVEAVVLLQWSLFPYWPQTLTVIGDYEASFTFLLAPLSPLAVLVLLYGRPLAYCANYLRRRPQRLRSTLVLLSRPLHGLLRALRCVDLNESAQLIKLLQHPRLLLAIAVFSGAVMGYFPYRADLNPLGTPLGVDSPLYIDWIRQMQQRTSYDAVGFAFSEQAGLGSKSMLLIPVYAVSQILGISAQQAIEGLPVVLGPLLSVATYLFVSYGLGDKRIAGLASVLTTFSFNITVGYWGGYYANWLALAEVYLFLGVLLRFHQSPSPRKLLALAGLSSILFLTHPWTWVLIITVALVFSINVALESKNRYMPAYVIVLAAIGVGVDILKNAAFGPRTIAQDLASKTSIAGLHELAMFWPNTINALLVAHEGLLGSTILLGLAAVAALVIKTDKPFNRLLLIWLMITGALFAFFDSYHQARLLYNLPLPIMETLGLLTIATVAKSRLTKPGLLILLVLFTASWAMRAIIML